MARCPSVLLVDNHACCRWHVHSCPFELHGDGWTGPYIFLRHYFLATSGSWQGIPSSVSTTFAAEMQPAAAGPAASSPMCARRNKNKQDRKQFRMKPDTRDKLRTVAEELGMSQDDVLSSALDLLHQNSEDAQQTAS